MRTLVVSPSVREFPPEYFDSVSGKCDHIIIDDSNGKADRSGLKKMKNVIYVDDAFQDKYFGGNEQCRSLIPRRNPSCKNFGLLYAWREKYDLVVLLDDDCDTRVTPDFMDKVPVGKEVTAKRISTESGWVNTLTPIMNGRTSPLFPRGYPYEHRNEAVTVLGDETVTPSFNEGMWFGTPDINGMDKLTMKPEDYTLESGVCDPAHTIVGWRCKLPLSIMNVQLERKLIPAFYQPSDYDLYTGFKVRRHDDVWSAYVLKKIMDVKGDVMTFGEPMIYHRKAGDPIKEAISEHTTNLIQPYLMCLIDEATYGSMNSSESYGWLAQHVSKMCINHMEEGFFKVPKGDFQRIIKDYMKRVSAWAELCSGE